MSRKPKEDDQVIDLKEPKKETFVVRWFNDNAVNDKADIKQICDLTARSAEEQFHMYLKSGNTETYAVVFYATFMAILEFIKKKQKMYNEFTIQIANSINIGFCNNDSEDNEKVGNFLPIIEYISTNRNIVNDNDVNEDTTTEQCIRWKQLNIRSTAENCKEIQENAYEKLRSEYRVSLRTSEAVIPLFCIFMDNIANFLKFKYKEAEAAGVSEIHINIMGLFDSYYSYDVELDKEIIEYTPNITTKLALKQDDTAARD